MSGIVVGFNGDPAEHQAGCGCYRCVVIAGQRDIVADALITTDLIVGVMRRLVLRLTEVDASEQSPKQ